MIDIHSHLIPNIDDGAKSISETIELIKEAEKAGFTDIILTPHYMVNAYEPSTEEILLWKQKMQEILDKENIHLNLHTGMEVYITEELSNLIKQDKILMLGNSKYILMELPLNTTVRYLDNIIFKLQSKNITPIIAHPERYRCVQENVSIVKKLIESECMIQCNYGSILGIYGKRAQKTVKYLLKNNLVHLLGTDTHKQNTIYPKVEKATKKIIKIIGKEMFNKLTTENARNILKNN